MSRQKQSRALVTILEDVETAHAIVEKLHQEGFSLDKIELVTRDIHIEAPQIESPYTAETTMSSMLGNAGKGAGIGAAAGLVASVLAPFPGVGLAMIAIGGLVGGAMGGIAGIVHATEDDSVELPKLEQYEQMVNHGHFLVVVLGTHDEVAHAEKLIAGMPYIHNHVHPLRGHEFHEHPAHDV